LVSSSCSNTSDLLLIEVSETTLEIKIIENSTLFSENIYYKFYIAKY
jgi:hypothetical protein